MKEPEAMSLAEIRAELQRMGVTQRYISFVLRELAVIEHRVRNAKPSGDRQPQYDVTTAHFNVLRQHGMADRDLTLNRKGRLFVELANRELEEAERAA
jgi:DNA-binding transcriptional regulator GbsR (MarR family)